MRKRALGAGVVIFVALLLLISAFAAEAEQITVFYTNDIHSYMANSYEAPDKTAAPALRYSTVAALKKSAGNALLVDAGDHIQGTAYGSMDKGGTIIKLMNAAGYDLATAGNHEFDYGMSGFMNAVEQADFDYVSCNFYHEKAGAAGDSVLKPYKIFEAGGKKIAFIGITTPETISSSTPYFRNEAGEYIYGIAGGEDGGELYAAVQKAIDAAAKEADIIIALGHLGIDLSSRPWTSEEVIANTTGLDAFIDGHSHTVIEGRAVSDKGGSPVWLTQTGEYLGAVGKMTISADGSIKTGLLTHEDLAEVTPDAAVKAIEDAWISEIDVKLGEVIGRAAVTLDNYDKDGNRLARSRETNSGDFSADALYYLFSDMGMEVDVAVMNGGGVRNQAITGDISYKTCKDIHPFGNVACLLTVSGQQLLDFFEWSYKEVGSGVEDGSFMHVSGIKLTIDASVPSTVQVGENDVWEGGPTGEYRVKDVQVFNSASSQWEPLDLEASYNLAGYNYTLRDLGGGFAMLDGAVNVLDYVMEDYMVMANYVQSFAVDPATGLPTIGLRAGDGRFADSADYSDVYGTGRVSIIGLGQPSATVSHPDTGACDTAA